MLHCHRSYMGCSFGTKHSKIIIFINAVTLTLMNKCCKHFSSEWPNEAFSVPLRVSLYCSRLYLNQKGTFSPSLLYASRWPCTLTAVYEWQLICNHWHILTNNFSLFPARIRICLLPSKPCFSGIKWEGDGKLSYFSPPSIWNSLWKKVILKIFSGITSNQSMNHSQYSCHCMFQDMPASLHLPRSEV